MGPTRAWASGRARKRARAAAALLASLAPVAADCGEIPGLAPALPPSLPRTAEMVLSNDFLGRGGSVDDFRTQQVILAAEPAPSWLLLVDHSILTIDDPPTRGRIDQLSASLGRRLVNRETGRGIDTIAAGLGLRSTGEFAGERMQNGFHRLVGSDIDTLPYTGERRTDVTAWLNMNHYRTVYEFASWRAGYWLRGASLLTSDGQLDSTAAAFAVASWRSLDVWLGVRGDWRSGYDTFVTRETAHAEQDAALVLGARFGPVVLETVQQFDNDASYGQLRFVAGLGGDGGGAPAAMGADFSVLLPSVQLRVAGRRRLPWRDGGNARWQRSVFLAASYGEPQYRDDTRVFVRSRQLNLGLEFETPLAAPEYGLSAYLAAGAGYRDEKAESTAGAPQPAAVARAVASLGAGIRLQAARPGERWRFRLQLGALSRLPLDDAVVTAGDTTLTLQRAGIDVGLGLSFDYR